MSMKKYKGILLYLFVMFGMPASSQTIFIGQKEYNQEVIQSEEEILSDDDHVYTTFSNRREDQAPSFPGGKYAMKQWIRSNSKYPLREDDNYPQYVSFVVERDGSISNIEYGDLDYPPFYNWKIKTKNEIIRLLKSMPKWIPGKVDGEVVRGRTSIKYSFYIPH